MQTAKYICTDTAVSESLYHHYALNFPLYTHFTSPIRRYADIIVHRLLWRAINKVVLNNLKKEELSSICNTCNRKKQSASRISDDCDYLFLCHYLLDRPAQLEAVVLEIGVKEKTFLIYVPKLGIEKQIWYEDLKFIEKEQDKKCTILKFSDGTYLKLSFFTKLLVEVSTNITKKPLELKFQLLKNI